MQIGLTMEQYWTETPTQFAKRIKVYEEKEAGRVKEIDTLNYYLGRYIGIAVNDPKKYPDKPFLSSQAMTSEEMQSKARDITNKIRAQNRWQHSKR